MAKSHTKPTKGPKAADPAARGERAAAPEGDAEELRPTELTADDEAFLDRLFLFLFNIRRYAVRAARQGYTMKEHKLGWSLWSASSGQERPFTHWIAEFDLGEAAGGVAAEHQRLLQEIDAFENLWFPRVRTLIARIIPKENVERFTAAFFKNLSQQPLGPKVVSSVGTLLSRIEELKESKEPGARELYKTLGERGLTQKKMDSMRGLIASAEQHQPAAEDAPIVSAVELAEAKRRQLDALEQARLWYNDWATMFRGVFGTREQITLALTSLKRRSKGGDDEGNGEGAEDEDAEGEEPPAGAAAPKRSGGT
jgi:hypothetical protein